MSIHLEGQAAFHSGKLGVFRRAWPLPTRENHGGSGIILCRPPPPILLSESSGTLDRVFPWPLRGSSVNLIFYQVTPCQIFTCCVCERAECSPTPAHPPPQVCVVSCLPSCSYRSTLLEVPLGAAGRENGGISSLRLRSVWTQNTMPRTEDSRHRGYLSRGVDIAGYQSSECTCGRIPGSPCPSPCPRPCPSITCPIQGIA